jgi:hypothetical protein
MERMNATSLYLCRTELYNVWKNSADSVTLEFEMWLIDRLVREMDNTNPKIASLILEVQTLAQELAEVELAAKVTADNWAARHADREKEVEFWKDGSPVTIEEVCQSVCKEMGYEDWDQVDCVGETMLKKIVQQYSHQFKISLGKMTNLYLGEQERADKYKKEFDFAAKVAATQTEKLELAQRVIKSISEKETYSEVQIIAKNYLSDQSPEFDK